MEEAYCSGHQSWLPQSHFYHSSLKAGETRCKQCNCSARRERRRQHPLQRLQWKMYQMEHKRGGRYPTMDEVKSIVERFKGSLHQDLCIVRYFPDLALDTCPWNAVLVTTSQARRLPRDMEKRMHRFPIEIQREMMKHKRQHHLCFFCFLFIVLTTTVGLFFQRGSWWVVLAMRRGH